MRTQVRKARESSSLPQRQQDFYKQTLGLRRAPQSERRSNYEYGVATARCICPCQSGDRYPSGYQAGGVCPEGREGEELGQGSGYGHEVHGDCRREV